MASLDAAAVAPFDVEVAVTGETDVDGRVPLSFTAIGGAAPGVWSPGFGRPRPLPMTADGSGRWRLEVRLPADSNASWAGVPDVRDLIPSPAARLRALVSHQARVALGTDMDARFSTPMPVAPSLYRLIGTPPDRRLAPNIGLIPTPGATHLDGRALCAPAHDAPWHDLRGHRLVRREETPLRHSGALLLDGEVLRRLDGALADTGWVRTYLDNRGATERFADHAHPYRFARRMAPLVADADGVPDVVVGVSAAAPSALVLGLLLGATRVLLLSPAFLSERTRARLVTDAAAHGVHLDVRAGTEEHGAGNPRRSLRDSASRFVDDVCRAGGDASFATFAGGHDLPAWHVALLDALRGARAGDLTQP